MDTQTTINAIGTLAGTIDALNRAEDKEAIKKVTEKLLELVNKLS